MKPGSLLSWCQINQDLEQENGDTKKIINTKEVAQTSEPKYELRFGELDYWLYFSLWFCDQRKINVWEQAVSPSHILY